MAPQLGTLTPRLEPPAPSRARADRGPVVPSIPSVTRRQLLALFLLCIAGLFGVAPSAWAQSSRDPVESGRSALRSQSRLPWYDAQKDDLQPIVPKPEAPQRPDPPAGSWNLWSPPGWMVEALGSLASIVFYGIITAILVTLVWLLARAFGKSRAKVPMAVISDEPELTGDVDRVEQLPFPLARPRGDLLSEAQRLYQEGDFNGAIVYLYSYELVQLDKNRFIELTQGKTNRQYLRDLRPIQRLAQLIEQAMVTFEDAFFGKYQITRAQFEACWQNLGEFHAIVRREVVV